ncbi:MAG: class I SAM-dependent DNA methyltransferase [Selenomonadaceae bacterium]|nr:class I SAM-dependent DNA methyltransferase [Selenomonadaceae bacterium]
MEKIKNFIESWKNHGYEKGESQKFWLAFLRDVLNISEPEKFINFEVPVKLKHKSFIDAFLPDTKVIIEQKSSGVKLEKNQTQSDGEILSPYEQAQRYGVGLPLSMHPRFIIVCNFKEFLIYDMELMSEPTKIFLEELQDNFHAFDFMIDPNKNKIQRELEISLQAGEIVGKIYNALKKNYLNPNSEESLQSLNKLCVRLVFCFYAESAGIFGEHKIFRDFLKNSSNIRRDLLDLFEVLNTEKNLRDPYLSDELKIFPYVNGGLFAEKNIEIPNFTEEIKNLFFDEAENFNWSKISPTIFGAVFESTLNPATRRIGGMHYTSIENIHKVIDPLFLDDLHEEFFQIKNSTRNKNKKLLDFQKKLSELKFFDPACGSGNFLTESFISLRRLENEILKEILKEKILLGEFSNPIKISINQFYGIEINDFAVSVAQTALWIAELQMIQETQEIIHRDLNFLPLKSYANIFEGNALKIDWRSIFTIRTEELGMGNDDAENKIPNYIFGNPPFVGKTFQTAEQKADIKNFFKNSSVDYVACWYEKTSDFISDERILGVQKVTKIQCAFVSTNSICQGEQVAAIFANTPIILNFAHRTFIWDSESKDKAHVHCVILGFANFHREKKFIFDGDKKILAKNINFYLDDAENFFIQKRNQTLQKNVPQMIAGNRPADGGNLILSEDEKNILLGRVGKV